MVILGEDTLNIFLLLVIVVGGPAWKVGHNLNT